MGGNPPRPPRRAECFSWTWKKIETFFYGSLTGGFDGLVDSSLLVSGVHLQLTLPRQLREVSIVTHRTPSKAWTESAGSAVPRRNVFPRRTDPDWATPIRKRRKKLKLCSCSPPVHQNGDPNNLISSDLFQHDLDRKTFKTGLDARLVQRSGRGAERPAEMDAEGAFSQQFKIFHGQR